MRIVALLLFAVMLSGCATTSSPASSVRLATLPPDVTSFAFQDDRPAEQRISRADSGGLDIYLGDDKIKPTPPDLLKTWLHKRLASELVGRQVALTEFMFNIYDATIEVPPIDDTRSGRAAAVASVRGGYLVAPLAIALAEWLSQEISDATSYKQVIIKITGIVDGVEFGTFISEYIKGRITEESLQAILVKTLDQVIPEVSHAIGGR